ncbi:MAG: STAS domain-containing protein [Lachnospiraceae bacterium]|nr:STAS domain-containing protein [Lachnospiraceae bacterium]MBR1876342.1 STAS domain-containing protein [Lachnospiraceae bacterium]
MKERIVYMLCERVDAANSPAVQNEMDELSKDGTGEFVIDFAENKYVSSAGLRAILFIQKKMAKAGGREILINVPESVKEIFDVTGYSRFLNIE